MNKRLDEFPHLINKVEERKYMNNNDFIDRNSIYNITVEARHKNSIEQINEDILESAKQGWFIAEPAVHKYNDISDISREIARFKEDDLEVVWLRNAGYHVKVSNDSDWWSLSICWFKDATWDEENRTWVYDTEN